MKRMICLICALLIAVSFTGCAQGNEKLFKPVNFYYSTNPDHYEKDAITAERRESQGYENDLEGLIQLYLDGPLSNNYINPFPDHVTVNSVVINSTNVELRVSEEFAQLSDIEMTTACACLTMTVLELSDRGRLIITSCDASDNIIYTVSLTKDQILLSVD